MVSLSAALFSEGCICKYKKISTLRMLFFGEGRKHDKQTNGQTHIGGWVENVMNGQTHIGGWVENVTNGRMDARTVKMGTHGHTHGKLFSKEG